jgi:4-amino-4-deoxy-L-arabinose transferase-like glycosyltransferase
MRFSHHQRFSNTTVLLAGIFLLGLVVRLGWIDAHSLWGDEVLSIDAARNGLPYIFASRFGWVGNQTTWYYALIWLLVQPLDPASSAALVRLPSALAGAFLPLVIYRLGRELFSRAAGLIAALMVALSPIFLDYSHDNRPYSLLAFLTAASVYCLVMAERTGKAGWWAGFVAAAVANLLNDYLVVTLVMPALAPYLAWALWRAWRERREQGNTRRLVFLLISLGVVALVGVLMLLEVMHMPRSPIDWSRFSVSSLPALVINLLAWFTGLGFSTTWSVLFSLTVLLTAFLGVLIGVRRKQWQGVAICSSLCFVPLIIVAIVTTSNLFFPRYIIFVGPFLFLLAGNTLASAVQLSPSPGESGLAQRSVRAVGVLLTALTCLLFALGALNYIKPDTHPTVSYRPDFRGAARYLSTSSNADDTIIVADDPALGYDVTNLYWDYRPPAHLYDVRDPLLFRAPVQGNIYWVVSSLDSQLVDGIAAGSQGWLEVVKLENVVVLKESASGRDISMVVEQMADKLDALHPGYQPTLTMRGGVLQARGDLAGAARLFRAAGTFGGQADDSLESLRTAEGFAQLGSSVDAWRAGVIAKAAEPYRPQIHRWLAQQLQQAGYSQESKAEGGVAGILQSDEAVLR